MTDSPEAASTVDAGSEGDDTPPASGEDPGALSDDEGATGPANAAAGTGSSFGVVMRSPFRWLFWASVTSSLGDWIGLAAVVTLTRSVISGNAGAGRDVLYALSGVMIARLLPSMVLGPVAGVFADRWDRRRLLIATDLGRAAVFLVMPFAQDVWALFLATIVIEVMATLFIPVKDAIVPTLVPRGHLVQANQLSLLATYGTLPLGGFAFAAVVVAAGAAVGEATGSGFVQQRPESVAIWLNAITFLVSAWFVGRIPGISGRGTGLINGSEQRPGAWQELVDGFRFLSRHMLVRSLVFGVMAACAAAGAVIAIGEVFSKVLNAGSEGYGIMQGVVGTGLVAGILAAGWLERRVERHRLFGPAVLVAGVGLIATALMPRLDLAMVPAMLMGFGGGVAFIVGYTLLQTSVSDDMRGRAFGAFNTAVRFSLFASLVVAPLLVGLIGPETSAGGVTPYTIGGVRLTLMAAGVLAMAGGVASGWRISRTAREAGTDTGPARTIPGFFVAFEGGDGAGKSTQIELLRDALSAAGLEPVVTREPGGTRVGERIREVVLDRDTPELDDRTEALLYAAARAQHVVEVIGPALEANQVVLSDRYVDSSVVYQGVARGLGSDDVRRINRWATDHIAPDLVVLLDLPPDEGLRRAGRHPDRLEDAGLEFHHTVNDAFRRLALLTPDRWLVVDATESVQDVHARIREAVWERLALSSMPPLPDPDAPTPGLPPPTQAGSPAPLTDMVPGPGADGGDESVAGGHGEGELLDERDAADPIDVQESNDDDEAVANTDVPAPGTA